ncbi:MAG: hypothetical protein R3358_09105 [Woeseiaceae bacterium]|nr:hypothetical protein [Woeseiaceae bacterium]
MSVCEKTFELPSLQAWNLEKLPLVLVTAGDGVGEFEVLYDHLERLAGELEPSCQSLIVARPELPDILYQMLRARTKDMPHVHIRRLDDDTEDCVEVGHEAGRFYATPPHRKAKESS